VDIIGIITDASNVNVIKLKSGEDTQKRVIHIHDKSEFKIECTIWGEIANNPELKKNNIIALKGVKIGEFNENKIL